MKRCLKIPVTNAIRDRALREAKGRKGLVKTDNTEARRQTATSGVDTGEMRKTRSEEIPGEILKLVPDLKKEKYLEYKAEFESRRKKG